MSGVDPQVLREEALKAENFGGELAFFARDSIHHLAAKDYPIQFRRGWPLTCFIARTLLTPDNWILILLQDAPTSSIYVGSTEVAVTDDRIGRWLDEVDSPFTLVARHEDMCTSHGLRDCDALVAVPLRRVGRNAKEIFESLPEDDATVFTLLCDLSTRRQARWLGLTVQPLGDVPKEPRADSEEGKILHALRRVPNQFVFDPTWSRQALLRLKRYRFPIESASAARRRGAEVPRDAKGWRLRTEDARE